MHLETLLTVTVNKKSRLLADRKKKKIKTKSNKGLYSQEIFLKNVGDSRRCSCTSYDLQHSVWEQEEGHGHGTARYTRTARAERSAPKCIPREQRDEPKGCASAGAEDC